MPLPNPTVDDLVTDLRRSKKTNIVVEGKFDSIIYGELVDCLGRFKTDFFPAGGRSTLLALYDKLSCYESEGDFRHAPVVFIADRDAWIFDSGIPAGYNDIIWTDGYSIENDLYEGTEPSLEQLMTSAEKVEHQKVLNTIAEWFAFEVEEFLNHGSAKFATHCDQVLLHNGTTMDPGFRESRGFRTPDHSLNKKIRSQYQSQLRGKLLFQMLVRFLSKKNRDNKYSEGNLYEIALRMNNTPHPLMDKLIPEIKKRIQKQECRMLKP